MIVRSQPTGGLASVGRGRRTARGILEMTSSAATVGVLAPNRFEWGSSVRDSARSAPILVKHSTRHTSRPRMAYVLDQAGVTVLACRAGSHNAYVAMLAEVAPACRTVRARSCSKTMGPDRRGRRRVSADRVTERGRDAVGDDRSTSVHPERRIPKWSDAVATTTSQQRLFIARPCAHERDRVCVPVPVLPLIRHGDRQTWRA